LFENDPLWYNFQNSVPKVFTASSIEVVVFKCRKIYSTGNQRNRALFTWEKISAASQTVTTARIVTKICRHQPPTMCSVLQMSSESVHFQPS